MPTITLYAAGPPQLVPVEMQGATTGGYAALRVAEAMGHDPEVGGWNLACWKNGHLVTIDPDAPVADLDGQTVYLGRER